MKKTKIEWCESTWNPVTGCKHDCVYCYARDMARRFEGIWDGEDNRKLAYFGFFSPQEVTGAERDGLGLKYRVGNDKRGEPKLIKAPYPYGFHPTLHRHRLDGLERWKKPRAIFVGSMTDLFGAWVPVEWIKAVFDACKDSPQHTYLFLTKNPARYELLRPFKSVNWWFGTTVTTVKDAYRIRYLPYRTKFNHANTFVSIEPLHEDLAEALFGGMTDTSTPDWLIIGAETGRRKNEMKPKREWVEKILAGARQRGIPVFMKDSLAKVWGKPLITEYPWDR